MDVAVGGTIYVLLDALAAGCYAYEDYVDRLDALAAGGFRMEASLYRRAVAAGDDVRGED